MECLHHMVILGIQNKITDFFMILAWASPFNIKILVFISVGEKLGDLKQLRKSALMND